MIAVTGSMTARKLYGKESAAPWSPTSQTGYHCRRFPLVVKSSAITVKSGPVRVVGPAE